MTAFRPAHPDDVTAGLDSLRELLLTLAALRRPDASEIHRLRVTCKRLRAAIRLLRHQGNAKRWRRCDHALRDLARHYGKAREAQVLHDTLTALAAGLRNTTDQRACRRLLAALPAPVTPKGAPRALRERVAAALAQFDNADLARPVLRSGWRESLARCRQLAAPLLAAQADDEQLHHCRKWVKYLGYQSALAGSDDSDSTALRKSLVQLGRQLGTLHDLVLLDAHLQRRSDSGSTTVARVSAAVQRRRQTLLRQAVRTGTLLFARPATQR